MHFTDYDFDEFVLNGEAINIYNSKKPELCEYGTKITQNNRTLVYNRKTKSVIIKNNNNFEVYNSSIEKAFFELSRLVKILYKTNEEKNGGILIHGTIAEKNKKAVLIIGNKEVGKTTTGLNLFYNYNYKIFSKDRSYLMLKKNYMLLNFLINIILI